MTLEMCDKEKMKEGEVYGIINVCKKCNLSEESVMKILQEQENLSFAQQPFDR